MRPAGYENDVNMIYYDGIWIPFVDVSPCVRIRTCISLVVAAKAPLRRRTFALDRSLHGVARYPLAGMPFFDGTSM